MGTKSASNILHGILVQHPIGYEFDVRSLEEEAINYGYNFTEGALTGFIARALRKEIISIKGTTRPKGTKRTRRLYTLVDKQDWAFKPAGVGSYPGREVHGKARGDEQLELIEDQTKSDIMKNIAENMGIPVMDIPMLEPKREFTPEELSLGEQQLPISQKLMAIAHEVMNLEVLVNKPEKSLADYSTNDLIEELRKRVK